MVNPSSLQEAGLEDSGGGQPLLLGSRWEQNPNATDEINGIYQINERDLTTAKERKLWEYLKIANNKVEELLDENSKLKIDINQIMQRLDQLEKINKPESATKVGNEYLTDEDELSRETDWILETKKKHKKRKADSSPEVLDQPGTSRDGNIPFVTKTKEKYKEKSTAQPPPINIVGIKQYQDLHSLMQEVTNSFKITTLNNNVIKVKFK